MSMDSSATKLTKEQLDALALVSTSIKHPTNNLNIVLEEFKLDCKKLYIEYIKFKYPKLWWLVFLNACMSSRSWASLVEDTPFWDREINAKHWFHEKWKNH